MKADGDMQAVFGRLLCDALTSPKLHRTKCCREHAGCPFEWTREPRLYHFQFLEVNLKWMATKH